MKFSLASLLALGASAQNLTDYLLSRYAQQYQNVITQAAFFKQVLNGSVTSEQVAYFFEQDIIYGRGFTSLCGNALNLLVQNVTAPTSNRTLKAIDNLGQTASGLADEDGKLMSLRGQLVPSTAGESLSPSKGTKRYVKFMQMVSSEPHTAFDAFVCSWTMGKAFVDVWASIQQNQHYKPNKIPQLQTIIDYWSDPSYIAAIQATGDLINSWSEAGWPKTADSVFLETLKHETAFWESVDSMKTS